MSGQQQVGSRRTWRQPRLAERASGGLLGCKFALRRYAGGCWRPPGFPGRALRRLRLSAATPGGRLLLPAQLHSHVWLHHNHHHSSHDRRRRGAAGFPCSRGQPGSRQAGWERVASGWAGGHSCWHIEQASVAQAVTPVQLEGFAALQHASCLARRLCCRRCCCRCWWGLLRPGRLPMPRHPGSSSASTGRQRPGKPGTLLPPGPRQLRGGEVCGGGAAQG